MPIATRPLIRASRLSSLVRQPQAPRIFYSGGSRLPGGTPGEASEQAIPLGLYYEAVLNRPQPIPDVKPEEPPTSSPKSPRSTPATAQEKARIIFGSRLAGPAERAERLEAIRNRSTLIAGVLVPPRPEEPDNCCMSGCVNCVWDRYRDEMEEWISASARAEKALQAQQSQRREPSKEVPVPTNATSMDDDGGGSETNWQPDLKIADRPKIAKDFWDDELYKDVPVGIREFMKQEKRLKEKHIREGTFGA
ncbi:hypothetical protein K445DRAFT_69861 [Daldinia sp. EC12]|nr:hypothetical protein K445DRAFT_69861 [Daldinia sp. EC12]